MKNHLPCPQDSLFLIICEREEKVPESRALTVFFYSVRMIEIR